MGVRKRGETHREQTLPHTFQTPRAERLRERIPHSHLCVAHAENPRPIAVPLFAAPWFDAARKRRAERFHIINRLP